MINLDIAIIWQSLVDDLLLKHIFSTKNVLKYIVVSISEC